jgi:peptidoglycan/LPS O-acetylase OafA/YrhL
LPGGGLFALNSLTKFLRNSRKTGAVSSAPPKGLASYFPPWRRAASPFALRENLSLQTLPGLNGARAIAALLVIFHHWTPLLHSNSPFVGLFPGPYAVIFFFVLSGFLITTLLLREEEREGSVNIRAFWARRLCRILPAFYVCLTLQAILIQSLPPDIIASFAYVSNYYQAMRGWGYSVVEHSWSLSVEEQFYFLWPMAFLFFAGNRKVFKRSLLAGIVAVEVARFAGNHFGIPLLYRYFAFEFRCDALMIGCYMAIKLKELAEVPKWMLNPALGAGLVVLFPLLMFPFKNRLLVDKVIAPFGYSLGAYASAVLIIQIVAYAPRFLTNPVMNYLGSLSYSIYLYHVMLLDLTSHLLGQVNTAAVVGLYVLGTIAAASLSHHLIEKPFMKLRQRAPLAPKPNSLDRLAEALGGASRATTPAPMGAGQREFSRDTSMETTNK